MSAASKKAYKSIFCSCWCLSLLLTLFVIFLLIKAIASPTVPPFYATCSLVFFIFLFAAASVSYVLFAVSERFGLAILTIIFIIAELLCGLLTALAIFVSPRYDPFIMFSRAPIEWIQNHRWLPAIFAGLFIPIFAIQIFALQRYIAELSAEEDNIDRGTISNAARRKATPYHSNKELLTTLARF